MRQKQLNPHSHHKSFTYFHLTHKNEELINNNKTRFNKIKTKIRFNKTVSSEQSLFRTVILVIIADNSVMM